MSIAPTIPVLAVPVINRPDLLRRMLASIDVPVGRLIVIDNSGTGELGDAATDVRPDAIVVDPPSNLGVAASWNFAIRTTPDAPWWCVVNADTEFAPGDLARLAAEMDKPGARWVGMNGDWRAFGMNAEAVDAVGLFDENYHPCYVEDCDYEYRCSLAGVPWYFIDAGATHAGSAAIHSEERYARGNARSYPANLDYHRRKWGGSPRGGEVFVSPFGLPVPVSYWLLDRKRLADQRW